MAIYEKLYQVQQTLKAPKNLTNSFGHYNYRSCETILESVKPILHENKLVLVLSDKIENVGDMNYIIATAKLIDIETGESIENTAGAKEELTKKGMDASQISGSASSYARKYALNGLFAIDDNKDSDATNDGNPELITAEQKEEMESLGIDFGGLCKYYKISNINELTKESAAQAILMKKKHIK